MSLQSIEQQHPKLQQRVKTVAMQFHQTFGAGAVGVESSLKKILGEKWPELSSGIEKQVGDILHRPLSIQEAAASLDVVEKRAKGDIPSPIIEALVNNREDFRANPSLVYTRKYTRPYRTGGHPKAKGLDVQFRYPMGWRALEGDRPNVIQKFTSENGRGLEMLMLMVHPLPPEFAQQDGKTLFTEDFCRSTIPEGGRYISSKPMVYDGQPGTLIIFDAEIERLDFRVAVRWYWFLGFYQGHFVSLQGGACTAPGSEGETTTDRLEAKAKLFEPFFKLAANTLVFRDQYPVR